MVEKTPHGRFTTRLLAVQSEHAGWLSLDVLHDGGKFVDVPNLAKSLIEDFPLDDGDSRYSTARHVDAPEVGGVIDLILDDARRSPVFVAGSGNAIPFGDWTNGVDRWLRQVHGIGHAVVLTPAATAEFTRLMPPGGEARAWTIRTFLRGAGDDDLARLTRHKFLGTQRLSTMPDRDVARLLGRTARSQSARAGGHPEVLDWERRFTELAHRELVDVEPSPPIKLRVPVDPTPVPVGEMVPVAWVRDLLGVDEVTETVLRDLAARSRESTLLRNRLAVAGRQLDAATQQVNTLVDTSRQRDGEIDDLYVEVRILEDQRQELDDEVRRLRSRLVRDGRGQEAYDATLGADPTRQLHSYSDLLDAIGDLADNGVVFSGQVDKTLALDEVDTIGKCLPKAWQACLALADYVRAKRAGIVEQGVDWYLEHAPSGYRTLSRHTHAPTETGITKQRYREERMFPVPTTVDPSGSMLMLAHFKLGRLAHQDPRLYYYDDTARTGQVVIGYIGRHLTNTQS